MSASRSLSPQGLDFLAASRMVDLDTVTGVAPILIVSLVNGIGGAFRAYDAVGILLASRIAVECDAGASRVTLRRWPETEG